MIKLIFLKSKRWKLVFVLSFSRLSIATLRIWELLKGIASDRPRVASSKDAGELLLSLWNKDKIDFVEEFNILLLNRNNRVLGIVDILTGGVTGTVADPKVIFVAALKAGACNISILITIRPVVLNQAGPMKK